MSEVNAELVEDIQKRAIADLVELNMELLRAADGIGNHDLDRSERLARFAEFALDGTLDTLRGMGAPAYQHLVDDYNRDMRAELEARSA